MEISYRNDKLKRLCEECRVAERKLGKNSARQLRARLSDLEAAQRVTDLVAGRPHPLTGDREGQFALDLADGKRLVFCPDHSPYPTTQDGKRIDWSFVVLVCIEFIGDYHD